MINISMGTAIKTSKEFAFGMLVSMQALFLATTIWDFFLTVLVHGSHRALVFSALSSTATVSIIIAPWAVCIALLLLSFIVFLFKRCSTPIRVRTHYQYGYLGLMYTGFAILALTNPLVMWPVVLNYIVNVAWVCVILYYRIQIKRIHGN